MTSQPVRTWSSPEAVEVWRRGAALRARTLGVATARLLDAAGVEAGQRVLDLAAGSGEQSLVAAARVGAAGSVLATDISPNMLEEAARAASEAGLTNVTTLVADASAIELEPASFDAAISRFGLMFLPDLHQALVRVHRALKPGARFAALVWSTEANNPYISLQLTLIREMDRMPSPLPSLALTVSLSAPGVLSQAFSNAGFRAVDVSPIATPREFPSYEEALSALQSSSPAQGDLQRAMTQPEREHYAAELAQRLRAVLHSHPDGACTLPGEALLAVGAA